MEASTQAYEALSDHFKESTGKWLKEDEAAQRNRTEFPASMDIYDATKDKGVRIYKDDHQNMSDTYWKPHPELLFNRSSWRRSPETIPFVVKHPGYRVASKYRKSSASIKTSIVSLE